MRWLLVWLVLAVSPVLAQAPLTESFTQPGGFVVEYPAGWQVEVDEITGFAYLTGDDLQLTLYTPAVLESYGLGNFNTATLTQLILELNDVVAGELEALQLGQRAAATYSYTDEQGSGVLVARTFRDRSVGLIDAHAPGDVLAENIDLVLQIATTFDMPPVPAPESLTGYAETSSQVIDELEDSGFLPAGSEQVFTEPYVFASGTNLTQPLAPQLSLSDVIVAGTLSYTPSNVPVQEICVLVARRTGDNEQLEVGMNSNGSLFVSYDGLLEELRSDVEVSKPRHVLFMAMGERLLVYLDGERVGDREIAIGSGHFGLRVQASGSGATCEVSDLWVYRVPGAEPGVCEITADNGAANKRSGPGTTLEIAGILEDGMTQPAVAQATGADGFIWWQLDDGTWVREDVVSEQGACQSLPVQ